MSGVEGLTVPGDWIEGEPWPLGATWLAERRAFNFALYSRHARSVTLLLYDENDPATPVRQVVLDPIRNKTGLIWHCRVADEESGGATLYGYRVDGPRETSTGHRFDGEKVLLDPFAAAVHFPPDYDRFAAAGPGPTAGKAPLGKLLREEAPPAGDPGPRPRHGHDLVVYELHVRGFTARANSGVAPEKRGTFAGLAEKIDPDGPDLLGVVVGSEGTLGVVTEVTVRIVRVPEAIRTLLAGFRQMDEAGGAVSRIVAAGILPWAIEMMDRLTIEAAERAVAPGYPEGAGAVLLVELYGVTEQVEDDVAEVERI